MKGFDEDPDAPASSLDDEALAHRVGDFVKRARDHLSKWREEARTAYAFVAGDHWDDADKIAMQDRGRVCITFNRVGPIVHSVAGNEINNRQEAKVYPRGMPDAKMSEAASLAVKWARQQAEVEDEESSAFLDLLVSGLGWTETRMDYGETPEGKIVVERFDPEEGLYDPAARKKNLADARELARARRWRLDAAVAQWPEHADALSVARPWLEPGKEGAEVQYRRPYEHGDAEVESPGRARMIEIAHYQWCETRPVVVYDEGGQRREMPAAEFAAVAERARAAGVPVPEHVRQARLVWFHAFVAGGTVLERGPIPAGKGPTLRCMTGMLDRNSGLFYGIVRAMLDPQRWSNKWLAQALDHVNRSGRGGYFYEEGSITDIRQFETTAAKPGANTALAPGGLSQIKAKEPPIFPQAFDRLLTLAIGSIPDVTGINREMLGMTDRDQPGIVEAQRKQAAQAILAPLFDSLRRYRKDHTRLLLAFIHAYVPADVMLRVLDDEGNLIAFQASALPQAMDYDVVIDQVPTSPNAKMEIWSTMVPMLPAIMRMGPPAAVWGALLKYSPFPPSVVQDLMQALESQAPADQGPPPEMAKAQAEIAALGAKTQAEIASKAAKTQADIQLAQAREQSRAAAEMARMLRNAGIMPVIN